jgi:hypothetical protein
LLVEVPSGPREVSPSPLSTPVMYRWPISYAQIAATKGKWVIFKSTMRALRRLSAGKINRRGRMRTSGIKFCPSHQPCYSVDPCNGGWISQGVDKRRSGGSMLTTLPPGIVRIRRKKQPGGTWGGGNCKPLEQKPNTYSIELAMNTSVRCRALLTRRDIPLYTGGSKPISMRSRLVNCNSNGAFTLHGPSPAKPSAPMQTNLW